MYKRLADFAQCILCMLHFNAEIEGVFSQVKVEKPNEYQTVKCNLDYPGWIKKDNKACYDYEISETVTSLMGTSVVYNET